MTTWWKDDRTGAVVQIRTDGDRILEVARMPSPNTIIWWVQLTKSEAAALVGVAETPE